MILDDIVPRLVSEGIGTAGEDLWWGTLPSGEDPDQDPDPTIAVYESPGPAGVYAKDGPASTEARLQVLTRSKEYETAMSKALEAYAVLDGLRETVNGTRYKGRAMQRPFDVGAQDDAGRTIISCNYALTIRPP